jgi:hypothetical protein
MKYDSLPEPKAVTNAALDKLPLFATDLEIAVAIVGKQNASRWKREVIPILEYKGFPRFDHLHHGRPVAHVKQFYAMYLGITAGFTLAKPDGVDKVGTWSRRKQNDEERAAEAGVKEQVRRARARANSDAWADKKRKALEEYRAKKASNGE